MNLSSLSKYIQAISCSALLSFFTAELSIAKDNEATSHSTKTAHQSHRKTKKKHSAAEKLEHFKTNDVQKLQKKHDSILDLVEKSEMSDDLKTHYKTTLENVSKFILLAKETTETDLLSKLRKLKSFMFQELYTIENKLDLVKYATYLKLKLNKQKAKLTENQSNYSEETKKVFSFLLDNAEKLIDSSNKTEESTENSSKENKEENKLLALNQAHGFIKEAYNIPCNKCKKKNSKSKK